MPRITKITEQKRHANRRNIFLDGHFAFGCNVNVVARFRLQPDMDLSPAQIQEIEFGEVKQECLDKALEHLSHRLHSRAELFQKLKRKEWGDAVINAVIDDLVRMNYVNDARFARTKASASAQRKHHGRRRAFVDLLRAGVKGDVADQALLEVYKDTDTQAIACDLAMKYASRLRKLDPLVARRRLAGMLQRRGFDYQEIRPVIDQVLGRNQNESFD